MKNDARETCNTNSQINFKTVMLKSSICDYSGSKILVKRTITIIGTWVDAAEGKADKQNKQAAFKNCTLFTECISKKTSIT